MRDAEEPLADTDAVEEDDMVVVIDLTGEDIDNKTENFSAPKIVKSIRARVKSGTFQVTTKPLTTRDVMLFFQPKSRFIGQSSVG